VTKAKSKKIAKVATKTAAPRIMMTWETDVSYRRMVVAGGRALGLHIQRIPGGGDYMSLAIETDAVKPVKKKGDTRSDTVLRAVEQVVLRAVEQVFDDHAHENLGASPTLTSAIRRCERFAVLWMHARTQESIAACAQAMRNAGSESNIFVLASPPSPEEPLPKGVACDCRPIASRPSAAAILEPVFLCSNGPTTSRKRKRALSRSGGGTALAARQRRIAEKDKAAPKSGPLLLPHVVGELPGA